MKLKHIILPALLVCSLASSYALGGNTISIPDSEGNVGTWSSMALDSNGYPVVSYVDQTNKNLKLMHCNDVNCSGENESISTVVALLSTVDVKTSLVLDTNGYPVISYTIYNGANFDVDLGLVRCNDPNCSGGDESITTPDTAGRIGYWNSLALDSDGYPVIAYQDIDTDDLKLMHCNDLYCSGGDESITAPDTEGDVGRRPSLVLDSDGYPVVSYQGQNKLKLMHCNDPNCSGGDESIVILDSSGRTGDYSSLALDSNGYPVVAYHDGATGKFDLKVAHCNDVNCSGDDETITAADTVGRVGYWISMALDINEHPVISYRAVDDELKVMVCNDVSCVGGDESTALPDPNTRSQMTSLVLDSNGYPVVSYYDLGRGNLKVLTCDTIDCNSPPDTTAPVLSLPDEITQNNDAGQCGANVTFNVTATDDSGSATVTAAPTSGSFFAVGTTAVAATATDAANNVAQGSFNVTVNDVEAPVLVTQDTTLALNANGEVSLNVFDGALVSQSDNCSTVGSVGVSGPRNYTCSNLGQSTVWIFQDDPSSNEGSESFVLTITDPLSVCDSTPPVIIPNISGTQGNNGWYVSDVEVSWTVSDEESAVSSTSGCETTLINSDTASITLACEASSKGGTNSASVTIQRDATAPAATASVLPDANVNGWYNSDVTVSFSGADALSGIASCTPNATLSGDGSGQSASGTCIDNAGNVSVAATASGINIDKTAPTAVASISPAANANGWHNTDVLVSISGSDNLSGIATCGPSIIFNSEGAGFSTSGTCTDNAGNVSATVNANEINIDKTSPVVFVIGVVDGASYTLGAVPSAGCNTQDTLSGVATSAILALSGANPDGSGAITATCAGALDYAGNSGTTSVTYTVLTQQEATVNIQSDLGDLVDDGSLTSGQANGLNRPLNTVIRSLEKGNINSACGQLTDFIGEVNEKTPTPLDVTTAAELIADAEALQAAIGCN